MTNKHQQPSLQTPLQKLISKYSNYANNEDDTVRQVVSEIIKDAESLLPYEQDCIMYAVNATEKRCLIFGNKIVKEFSFSKRGGDNFFKKTFISPKK